MKRKQVAAALGKSLATVRRLEGRLLFPKQDANGHWRFNPRKVAELVRSVKRGKSLIRYMQPMPRAPLWAPRQSNVDAAAGLLRRALRLLEQKGQKGKR